MDCRHACGVGQTAHIKLLPVLVEHQLFVDMHSRVEAILDRGFVGDIDEIFK